MRAVRDWLEAIGLGQYADAFEVSDVESSVSARPRSAALTRLARLTGWQLLSTGRLLVEIHPQPEKIRSLIYRRCPKYGQKGRRIDG